MPDILDPRTQGYSISPYPPELQGEAASLHRRRALADMLMLRAMQPIQQPTGYGGIPVPISPLAGLSHMAQMGLGVQAGSGVAAAEQALASRYAGGLQGATKQVTDLMKSGDYAGASQTASQWPALKSVADALYKQQLPEISASEGMLYDKNAPQPERTVRPLQTFTPQSVPITTPTGTTTIPGQAGSVTGKITFPPANITNVQNFPENAAATALARSTGEGVVKQAETSRGAALQSIDDLRTLKNANEFASEGMKTGSFAGLRNAIDRFAETAGFKSPDPRISNTDNFIREISKRILAHTKELRPMSDADKSFLQNVLSGADLDDRAINKVLQIGIENSIKNLHQHNSYVERIASEKDTPAMFRPGFRVEMPEDLAPGGEFRLGPVGVPPAAGSPAPTAPGAPAAAIPLDEYLRRQRGR
jgi:hypothetical protein